MTLSVGVDPDQTVAQINLCLVVLNEPLKGVANRLIFFKSIAFRNAGFSISVNNSKLMLDDPTGLLYLRA